MIKQSGAPSWRTAGVQLRDYVIPLTTPFTDDFDLDLGGLRHNVRQALTIPGAGGLYIGSVYQEFWSLTTAERKILLETVADEAGGRIPIVAGVSSPSLRVTIELAEHAESAGADLLMVWPPIFGPRDASGVASFYGQVAKRSHLPMCVYSTTLDELGYYLDPTQLAALTSIDNVVCVKEASFSVSTYLSLVSSLGDRLAISTPFEEYWLTAKLAMPDSAPDFLMGSSRALYMQSPRHPYLADFLQLARAGDTAGAYAILAFLQDIVTEIQMRSLSNGRHPIALVKYATELLGMRGGPVRPPTPALTEADQGRVLELMRRVGLAEMNTEVEARP